MKVEFEHSESGEVKATGLDDASNVFLLAMSLASLRKMSESMGVEGALENLEKAYRRKRLYNDE